MTSNSWSGKKPQAARLASAPNQTRPDVEAAQARVRVADAQIERAQREGRFDVNLFGMYMRMDAGFPQRGFGDEWPRTDQRRLPLHCGRRGGDRSAARRQPGDGRGRRRHNERAPSAQLEAAQLAAEAEVAAARVRDEHARQALAVFTSDTRALARQNLIVVRQTYELGRGDGIRRARRGAALSGR